jgi:hypothetical protein
MAAVLRGGGQRDFFSDQIPGVANPMRCAERPKFMLSLFGDNGRGASAGSDRPSDVKCSMDR